MKPKLDIQALTPERFADLEALFNARGCSVARNCWCMYYRRSGERSPLPGRSKAEANRADFKALLDAGKPMGLLGYRRGEPVGWVSMGPRQDYAKLARSPVMKPVDEQPVWSIICFVVPPAFRGQGVAKAMLQGAVAYAKKQGVTLLEAYPVDRPDRTADENMWFGTKTMFDAAGFQEVARRKPMRPVVRLKPV